MHHCLFRSTPIYKTTEHQAASKVNAIVEKNYASLFPEPRIRESVKRDALFRDRAKVDACIVGILFLKKATRTILSRDHACVIRLTPRLPSR